MDGLNLSTIDQIDQDVFNQSHDDSDDEEGIVPLPDCIGIESAVQDDMSKTDGIGSDINKTKFKTRSEIEREMEVQVLRPDSIRRQILEQSLRDGNNKVEFPENNPPKNVDVDIKKSREASHVMNIVEKAGMQGIDKDKINKIINEASKGSLFYKRQAQRQEEIHNSIQKMLNKVKMATPNQIANARITCEKLMADLEKHRVLNRIIVHFDLDMFFAAVEIRDNPSLADKPVAVGGDSMVSTSNYIARRFGVRAAMPGFIAKKLCPGLILIQPNGAKYRQASSEVCSILELYDPDLNTMSLDEAYLDLTDYVKSTLERDGLEYQEYYDGTLPRVWWSRASEVIHEIRQAIFEKTKLTCSAGIACNALLAKISTDINKPNGQYMVEGYPPEIKDFVDKTPVGKVSGIGKVSGQFLNALGIETCGDIYDKKDYLPLVFYDINVKFYLRVAIGDGSTCMKSDEQRKSKSVERTFTPVRDPLILLDKLDNMCDELCTKYLKPYRIRGRTITLKLKRNTFTTTTKSYSLLIPTNDKLVIYSTAKTLLLSELKDEPIEISYRLLGVRLSNLADDELDTNQWTIDAMFRNQEMSKETKSDVSVHVTTPLSNESIEDGNDSLSMEPDYKAQDDVQNDCESHRKSEKPSNCKMIQDFSSANDSFKRSEDPCPISDTSIVAGESTGEDLECPYCFKMFPEFNSLESHTDRCKLKTSIDVFKPYFSQRLKANSDSKSPATQQTPKTQSSNEVVILKPGKRKQQGSTSLSQATSKLKLTPTSTSKEISTHNESRSNLSFFDKFIESNSKILSQSQKIEPFQCPYCIHGFLNFDQLQDHVKLCSKNSDK